MNIDGIEKARAKYEAFLAKHPEALSPLYTETANARRLRQVLEAYEEIENGTATSTDREFIQMFEHPRKALKAQ